MNDLELVPIDINLDKSRAKTLVDEHRQLKAILNITRKISREILLKPLLDIIMDEVKKAFIADRCTIFLLDEEKNELWSITAHGEEEIRFPKNLGIAGHVLFIDEVLNIKDVYTNSHFNPEIDRRTGYRTRNMLAVAIKNQLGETIGVFQVLNKLSGHFEKSDEELLVTITCIASPQIENSMLYEQQRKTFQSFVQTLASTIDARDPLTAGHSERISLYAAEVAKIINLNDERCEVLRYAALLHDYGKISLSDALLKSENRFTESQYSQMQSHPTLTRNILEKIYLPKSLQDLPKIAGAHHEKMDGSGYPDGLKDQEIPLESRILTVVDAFDAMTSSRRYSDRIINFEKVIRTLENDSGSHFDTYFVEAFKKIPLDRLVSILENEAKDLLDTDDLYLLSNSNINDLLRELRLEIPADSGEHPLSAIFKKYYHRKHLTKKAINEKNYLH